MQPAQSQTSRHDPNPRVAIWCGRVQVLLAQKWLRYAGRAFAFALATICFFYIAGSIVGSPRLVWNGARLAPTFAILSGHPPYYPMDRGPVLNTIYGPFTYLYYLPCGLFFNHVTLAIILGSLLAFVAFAIPVALVLWQHRRRLSRTQIVWLSALCFLQITAQQSLTYSVFNIHADAPAILFGSLCILFLTRDGDRAVSVRALCLSATCGVLAVWTKQTLIGILALPVAVLLLEPRTWKMRAAVIGWMAALNLLLLLIFSVWCGRDALLDNIWRVPASHSLASANFTGINYSSLAATTGARLKSVLVEIHVITGKYLALYVLALLVSLLRSVRVGNAEGLLLKPSRPAALFLAAALLTLPGGAAGLLKQGGFVNSETPFAWFLILALLNVVIEAQTATREKLQRFFLEGNQIVYAVFVAIAMLSLVGTALRLPAKLRDLRHPFDNDQETAVAVSHRYPGQYYFPWHPLAGLVGEGKLYHFIYGVYDRTHGGRKPAPEHFFADIPEKADVIGWPVEVSMDLSYLPDLQPTQAPPGFEDERLNWYQFKRK